MLKKRILFKTHYLYCTGKSSVWIKPCKIRSLIETHNALVHPTTLQLSLNTQCFSSSNYITAQFKHTMLQFIHLQMAQFKHTMLQFIQLHYGLVQTHNALVHPTTLRLSSNTQCFSSSNYITAQFKHTMLQFIHLHYGLV